jgi:hypothetical protein
MIAALLIWAGLIAIALYVWISSHWTSDPDE